MAKKPVKLQASRAPFLAPGFAECTVKSTGGTFTALTASGIHATSTESEQAAAEALGRKLLGPAFVRVERRGVKTISRQLCNRWVINPPELAVAKAVTAKPVKLQVNTSGAWKDVAFFDAGNGEVGDQVVQGAEAISRATSTPFRVVMHDGLQSVLMHCDPVKGWEKRT
jgi:hypothetical protein